MPKILSWNLLRLTGASPEEVAALARRERPDLLLLQEATAAMDDLPRLLGGDGHYLRAPLPGRVHGPAAWSPRPPRGPWRVVPLPRGAVFERVCLVLDLGDGTAVANVHLSHGQVLNRRQLRRVSEALAPHRAAAILGDFNLVGPCLLPGYEDVGPRAATHVAGEVVPLRIDRCLARGFAAESVRVLDRGASDHRPILVELRPDPAPAARSRRFSASATATALRRRLAATTTPEARPAA